MRCPVAAVAVAEKTQTSTALKIGSNVVQGPRKTLEDVLRVEQGLNGGFTYAAVLDGHGGELSAQWLYDELYEAIAPKVGPWLLEDAPEQPPGTGRGGGTSVARRMLPQAVRWPAEAGRLFTDVFKEVDAKLVDFLRTEFGYATMGLSGSTALVALVHPEKAVFASLGDCVAAVCRGGTPVKATQQHRVYGAGDDVLEEVERVKSTGAWVYDGRVCNVLAVSRAFGDPEFKGVGLRALMAEGARKGYWTQEFADSAKFSADPVIVEPDVTEIKLTPKDEFILMATDGLWDAMPLEAAVAYARKQFRSGKDAQQVAEAMTDIALRRYTADNVGVVVVDLRRDGAQSAGGPGASNGNGGGNGVSGASGGGAAKRWPLGGLLRRR